MGYGGSDYMNKIKDNSLRQSEDTWKLNISLYVLFLRDLTDKQWYTSYKNMKEPKVEKLELKHSKILSSISSIKLQEHLNSLITWRFICLSIFAQLTASFYNIK